MSECIRNQVIDQMKSAGPFALGLDDSTDGSFCAQLTVFVSYTYNDEFKDEFLCIINQQSRTRGEDIYQSVDTYFKANDFKWEPLLEF